MIKLTKSEQLADKIFELTQTGLFPRLKLAMEQFKRNPDMQLSEIKQHCPGSVHHLFPNTELPAPDGYDIHDKPIWLSSSLERHFEMEEGDVEKFLIENGLDKQCSPDQVVNTLH